MKKWLLLLLSTELIALSYCLFIIPNGFISFGVEGIASLIYRLNGVNPAINIVIINGILILLVSIILDFDKIRNYVIPALLIPIFIFINMFIFKNYQISLPETSITILVAGVLGGYGYSLIYRQGYGASIIFLLEELIGKYTKFHSKIYSWVLDGILLIILLSTSDYRITVYSLIIIMITKYMITKARFGINDSKMFYIITTKENEVKNYILHVLGYELTVLESRGGYTRHKNKVLLTVINRSDYYKLKSGIKEIDDKAFVAITDTYDVINTKTF
ncbi:MAG: YitT family protein [Bacilli bacterium]|nr:YitT family protein [Bacilli bacterium]